MKFFVPETVQTSAMDCGPAVLRSLLAGFGIAASYGRLREACQTTLDGTSIDTIEQVAQAFNLDAEQVMVPPEHLLHDDAILPAVLITQLPAGYTHFVIVWRKIGNLFQVMDPAVGRRWVRAQDLLASVYLHSHEVDGDDWREWAASETPVRLLAERIARLAGKEYAGAAIARVISEPGWHPLARLEAATRLLETAVAASSLSRLECERVLARLTCDTGDGPLIPSRFWPVAKANETRVHLRGAVLIRVNRISSPRASETSTATGWSDLVEDHPEQPLAALFRILSPSTRRQVPIVALTQCFLGVSALAEGLLFRSLFQIVADSGLPQQRVATVVVFALFIAVLLLVEYASAESFVRWGREIEARLSVLIFDRLSRSRNDYFGSRLISDLAERTHAIAQLRVVPLVLGRVLRSLGAIAFIVLGLCYLLPTERWLATVGATSLVLLAFAWRPVLDDHDLRVRTHAAGLARFYLDALLGLTAVHAHCAERPVKQEHEALTVDWALAVRQHVRVIVTQLTVLAATGFILAGVLIWRHLQLSQDPPGIILIAFWSLLLPVYANDLAQSLQSWTSLRTVILRLTEPLRAREETPATIATGAQDSGGLRITFKGVSVRASSREILRHITVDIPPGSFVGVVGPSGAGKSTLFAVLLGFMQPSGGELIVGGRPLTPETVDHLRGITAWVDPSVQLFNSSLAENICYPSNANPANLPAVLQGVELYEILERVTSSQQPLGDGGRLLSGGEGARVRFGRALMRGDAKLVLLDEAFRGLDREQRSRLLKQCRDTWAQATVLAITHDIRDTVGCDRVLVLVDGQVVEYASPSELAERDSTYAHMLRSEYGVQEDVWGQQAWRRLTITDGRLEETPASEAIRA